MITLQPHRLNSAPSQFGNLHRSNNPGELPKPKDAGPADDPPQFSGIVLRPKQSDYDTSTPEGRVEKNEIERVINAVEDNYGFIPDDRLSIEFTVDTSPQPQQPGSGQNPLHRLSVFTQIQGEHGERSSNLNPASFAADDNREWDLVTYLETVVLHLQDLVQQELGTAPASGK